MKSLRIAVALVSAAVVVLAYSSTPQAFHSGGVAECVGCHSMHSPKTPGSFLLVGSDQSSTCLVCHENAADTGPSSYHVSTVDAKLTGDLLPLQRTPGGDFGWLKKSYTYAGTTEDGATHGHNVIAVDNGYYTDTHNATSPGGSFPSNQLSCTSCHDPHGQFRRRTDGTIGLAGGAIWASGSYPGNEPKTVGTENLAVGVYRLLAGAGYTRGGVTFGGVPVAKVPSSYNRTEAATQTRAAYGTRTTGGHVTWGNWCATCHEGMHSDGNYVHPIDDTLGSTIAQNYNQYVKSGDMTGSATSSYTSLVPFIEATGDYVALAGRAVTNDSQLGGPGSTDQVSCLSCHRAHASGMLHALRFDMEYEFMVKGGQYIGSDNPEVGTTGRGPQQARGRKIADWQAAYYDRPAGKFSAYQRVLCNKCHAKD